MKAVGDVVRPTLDESTWLNKCIVSGFLFVFIDFSFASTLIFSYIQLWMYRKTQKPKPSL